MRYLIIAALLVSGTAQAGNGFYLGGVVDGYNDNQGDYQRSLERQFERDRQRRLIEDNNQLLQEQRDRQEQRDIDRIFGIQRR